MKASPREFQGEQTLAGLTELARTSVRPPTSARLERGLQVLSERLASGRARRSAWVRWSLVGTGATAALALALGAFLHSRSHLPSAEPPALTYHIEGGRLMAGGYLRESEQGGIKLSFSEGTELAFAPGTRGRIRYVDSSGARFAIEQGSASFRVTPRKHRTWLVDVGPFLVKVTGTVFTVAWDAQREHFELGLQRGHVIVSGPVSGNDIALQAGQRLMVDLPKGETLITEQRPAYGPDDGAAQAQDDLASVRADSARRTPAAWFEKPVRPAPAPAAGQSVGRNRHWAEALAAGHLDRILAEAKSAGIRQTLESASSDDLFALADAARYRRRTELARQALLAGRRRFPGSSRSLEATFLLGRVEEIGSRQLARAVAWYDEYLLHAPTGTYAAEALGRKMTLTNSLAGAEQARPVAEEYLRRFPTGSYAGAARALRQVP